VQSSAPITTEESHGGVATTGFLVHRFDGETFTTERHSARWMINHDIASWGAFHCGPDHRQGDFGRWL
jgi:hypothetical protein